MGANESNDKSDKKGEQGSRPWPSRTKEFHKWLDDNKDTTVTVVYRPPKHVIARNYYTGKQRLRLFKYRNSRGTLTSGKVVALPPGYRLSVIAAFLLTRGAFKRYVEPVIADMQHEYIDALAAGHVWHARYIAIRGHLIVIPGWIYAFIAGKLAALLRRGS
jgi:hypothetical protein